MNSAEHPTPSSTQDDSFELDQLGIPMPLFDRPEDWFRVQEFALFGGDAEARDIEAEAHTSAA